MTVAELITLLQAQPPHARVVVAGYESGADDVASVRPIMIGLNRGGATIFDGAHSWEAYEDDDNLDCRAILIAAERDEDWPPVAS